MMGFSAGGHLASTAGTHFDAGDPNSSDVVDQASCRPNFMILIHPVVTMRDKAHGSSKSNLLDGKPRYLATPGTGL